MIRALVVLSVLATIALVAGGQYVEARAGDATAELFAVSGATAGSVDVDLEGTPLLYHVALGRIPGVHIVAEQVESGSPPVTFAEVVLDLEQVEVDVFDLLDGPPTQLTVGDGEAAARIAEEELARIVERDRPGWEVRLEGGAITATGTVQGSQVRVVAEPRVVGGDLELVARRVDIGDLPEGAERQVAEAFGLRIALADLPGRLRFTDVAVEGDTLRLTAAVRGSVRLGFALFALS